MFGGVFVKNLIMKITASALDLCNSIVLSFWTLIVTGIIAIIAFALLPDPVGEGAAWVRDAQGLAHLIPFMGTYMISSACLRRIFLDNLGGDLSAIFATGVVIFFIGHLSIVIGLGMQAGYFLFEPAGRFVNIHYELGIATRVLHVLGFGAVSFLIFLLPCFVLYLLSRDKGAALASPIKTAPSCFDMMFSKLAFLTSGILAAVILLLAFRGNW